MCHASFPMKAIILAAGDGTRLKLVDARPKVLAEVAGRTLLERCLDALSQLGIRDFVLVTGYRAEQVREFVRRRGLDRRFHIEFAHNPRWTEGNAHSVWAARGLVGDRFLVAMGDHLFDPEALQGLTRVRGDFVGVFDSQPRYIDLQEATKARSHRGHAERLGRSLMDFKYIDAGLAICSERIFPVIERCLAEGGDEWNAVKRAWIAEHDLHIYDLKGAFWLDIDTAEDLRRAEALLREARGKLRDGVIARHLNRRLSRPISQLLARTSITPNQVSVASFLLAGLSALGFALGTPAARLGGGLLAQAASVLDGCDGELARMRGPVSRYGAWLDAVLDRWADAMIVLGMTYGLVTQWPGPEPWLLGFSALAGSFLISYTESHYAGAFGRPLEPSRFALPAKRDARLFIAMLGGLLDQVALALAVVALLSIAEVLHRLLFHREMAVVQLPDVELMRVDTEETPEAALKSVD